MTSSLIFEPSNPSFRLMASYLMALQGFVSSVEIYNGDGSGAKPWPDEDTSSFDAAASSKRLIFKPRPLVASMVKNCWPDQIRFEIKEIPPVSPGSEIILGVLENFLFGLGQSLLTNLFEEQRPVLEARYGQVAHWPAVWNFARVVRNAMSHGGRLTIRDQSSVRWKSLSYSSADNGRRIVNVDIWPGDLFFLVREMDAALAA